MQFLAALKHAASATRTHTGFEHHAPGKWLRQIPIELLDARDLARPSLLQNSLCPKVSRDLSERRNPQAPLLRGE